jgi:hypothetical protein
MQNFLHKYTIGLAQPLRESDVGMTSRAVSRNGRERPNGLAKSNSDTVGRLDLISD